MENVIWWGTAGSLARELKNDLGGFVRAMAGDYFKATGEEAGPEQQAAWRGSLKAMTGVFGGILPTLAVLLEYRLPMSAERCDVIFVGKGVAGKPKAAVLELKGWRGGIRVISERLVEADGGRHQHPEIQTLGYTGKLACAHSAAGRFDIVGCAWLYNSPTRALPFKTIPAFWRNEGEALSEFLRREFTGPAGAEEVESFLNGHYLRYRIFLTRAIHGTFIYCEDDETSAFLQTLITS